MKLKHLSIVFSLCVSLGGLTACSSDDGGGDEPLADAGDSGLTDAAADDVEEDATDHGTDGGDAGGGDADAEPGDIVVANVLISHQDGSEWSLDFELFNGGGQEIRVDHCTYAAETVAEATALTDGTVLEQGATLFPPGEFPEPFPAFPVEFDPSQGADTVEATMTVECVAASDENELNTTNNVASTTFDW